MSWILLCICQGRCRFRCRFISGPGLAPVSLTGRCVTAGLSSFICYGLTLVVMSRQGGNLLISWCIAVYVRRIICLFYDECVHLGFLSQFLNQLFYLPWNHVLGSYRNWGYFKFFIIFSCHKLDPSHLVHFGIFLFLIRSQFWIFCCRFALRPIGRMLHRVITHSFIQECCLRILSFNLWRNRWNSRSLRL